MQFAKILFCLTLLFSSIVAAAQPPAFTNDDTLRGSITPQRAWWDLTFYNLKVKVNPADKSISGSNEIRYKVLTPNKVLQIDLQPPLNLERAEQDGQALTVNRQGRNAYFIELKKEQPAGSQQSLTVWYSGIPKVAANAPWDGGFSWTKDDKGQPFVATSCQGLGASVWWPCKDHAYDEPDSQAIAVTVPKELMDVSNGRLRKTTDNGDGTHTFEWFVSNPINNYGVNVNIADYAFCRYLSGRKRPADAGLLCVAQKSGKSPKTVPASETHAPGIRTLVRPLSFL
jgi:aminopeptidase N